MTYSIGFSKLNKFLNCEWIVWVFIRMHDQRLCTVSLLNGTNISIILNLKNCKWVEWLDVLKAHHSGIVEVPDVPEEGANKYFVEEFLLEDGGANLPPFDCFTCSALRTLAGCRKFLKVNITIVYIVKQPEGVWYNEEGQNRKREEVERRIVILKLVVFTLLVAFKVILERWHVKILFNKFKW